MRTILQGRKECYFTHRTDDLEEHHIFGASNRKHSEEYGLKVWLTHDWHNEPPNGAHHCRKTDLFLKQIAQSAFEHTYGNREDFMRIFGRNYLND